MWVPALDGWYVTGREAAVAVLRDDATFTVDDPRFSTARVVGRSMLSTDGLEHLRHRAPFVDGFTIESLDATRSGVVLREGIATIARRLAATFLDEPTELRSGFAGPLAAESILLALDLGELEVATVLATYAEIVQAIQDIDDLDSVRSARAAYSELADSVLDSGSDVVASALTRQLSAAEVASNVAVILFGAIETAEGTITNAFRHALLHPGRARSAATAAVVEESMRLEPAATVVHRYATRAVDRHGARIEAGDFVVVSLAAANRDPATFADPDRFDPLRTNRRHHLTFATGPHACLGIHLARLEARLALDAAPPLSLDRPPSEPTGLIFRKPEALWVRRSAERVPEEALGGDADGPVPVTEG